MRKLALDPMEVPAVQAWLEDLAAGIRKKKQKNGGAA